MDSTVNEILNLVKEDDVKFIRLAFCDLYGMQKNISIMPDVLPEAFLHGLSFDASAISGFSGVNKSDLFLVPDPSTLTLMPWRPGPGRVIRFYCDIKNPDGSSFYGDSRTILKGAMKRCEDMGYFCKTGVECEFYLFQMNESGQPAAITLDQGGYLDISPLDKGENVRREICLCLEQMGLKPERSYHEKGPGQNEIDFKFSDVLTCADNFLTFKTVVKAIAAQNGLFASFMPKPLPLQPGSGMHINLSLIKNGKNIVKPEAGGYSPAAESFIAGILDKIREITLFLNPTANSYERFGQFEAPKYVSWSCQNRSQLICIPAATPEKERMELRSPDSSINPYLAFALILHAGLDGIEQGLNMPSSVDIDLCRGDNEVLKQLKSLPAALGEAVLLAENSSFVKKIIPNESLGRYITEKRAEAEEYVRAADKAAFYRLRYFHVL